MIYKDIYQKSFYRDIARHVACLNMVILELLQL